MSWQSPQSWVLATEVMPRGPWRGDLARTTLLLLLASQLLGIYSQKTQEKERDEKITLGYYIPSSVEYALHIFNQQSEDTKAYRLVHILDSWKEWEDPKMIISMELELRRTKCGKFEEDIDNCPFQKNPFGNNTFTCIFTITSEPWNTVFELLNKTRLEGLP